MEVNETSTKERIISTAISLFHTNGYKGTTIREIAKAAKVNSANISYYFNGKQGLLEACFVRFFEKYLSFLEEEVRNLQYESSDKCLKRALYYILNYQSDHHLLARFVWREVSVDSQIVREIISSYLMKERFYFKQLMKEAVGDKATTTEMNYFIVQLRSMITMPFLNSQYLREVWQMFPHEKYFVDHYFLIIDRWLTQILENQTKPLLLKAAFL
ncbi:forespore capture DNA-binding protein RefZ [Heyndrickxia ginsengihumi]|uniref:Forespore capture DNA-binding protein RefZ n=1 Tax=Heyndrickxia ginsengihumi TaxID=363870 RepID=A0A0A6V952_9BACI|nr:forespore capture DNA-binding protein RefZ [Heyndrickxia ginsengihumi]KHD84103.1 transcriptional regulator [Heyndrickxia ginsengihumi]MBE6182649.1 TetR/AcrR family transcriptional regulator [Bacillus sp. (in: firmicutes)]MCM3022038.1 forespore capture DNA-binding protein RefZ [Heyndrickxia ginsengihumi]NEY21550.1 forespore capture DNA-binding protein RefZ [Heyndrickxia ginsengihumi]